MSTQMRKLGLKDACITWCDSQWRAVGLCGGSTACSPSLGALGVEDRPEPPPPATSLGAPPCPTVASASAYRHHMQPRQTHRLKTKWTSDQVPALLPSNPITYSAPSQHTYTCATLVTAPGHSLGCHTPFPLRSHTLPTLPSPSPPMWTPYGNAVPHTEELPWPAFVDPKTQAS